MQGKYIPQKYRHIDVVQDTPNHCSRSFPNRRSFGGALDTNPPAFGVRPDMEVVSQRKPSATSATISKIASYPYGIYFNLHRGVQQTSQHPRPLLRRIHLIVDRASACVRIEC